MKKSNKIHIIMSGGGTGGHIFPALAIAKGLKKHYGDRAEILFVGAVGKMEMEKVPREGFPVKGLPVSGFNRRLTLKNLLFPFKLLISLCKANRIIRQFKPDVAVGTGGYASGPLLYRASAKGIPTLILEQNSYPGITNKLLAGKVDVICTAYPGMEKYFPEEKIKVTGSPVRREIFELKPDKKEALDFFGLEAGKKTLLVMGGSQGARKINEAVAALLDKIVSEDVQLIWQTGKNSFDMAKNAAEKAKFKENIRVTDFIYKMDMAYAAADVIVSRAGAIAVAEITAVRKPAVFIPLTSAAEDHQTFNARTLTNEGAALLLTEREAEEKLAEVLKPLLKNEKERERLVENLKKFDKKDATALIVDEVVKLIESKQGE